MIDLRRERYRQMTDTIACLIDDSDGEWEQPWKVLRGAQPPARTIEPNKEADALIWETGADIRHQGDAAHYCREGDFIRMPPRHCFDSCPRYYFMLFHELGHWASGRDRLYRRYWEPAPVRFAKEEVLCHLAAMFLSADFDIPFELKTEVSYVKGWLNQFDGGKPDLLRALPAAEIICDYLRSLRYGKWRHPQSLSGVSL